MGGSSGRRPIGCAVCTVLWPRCMLSVGPWRRPIPKTMRTHKHPHYYAHTSAQGHRGGGALQARGGRRGGARGCVCVRVCLSMVTTCVAVRGMMRWVLGKPPSNCHRSHQHTCTCAHANHAQQGCARPAGGSVPWRTPDGGTCTGARTKVGGSICCTTFDCTVGRLVGSLRTPVALASIIRWSNSIYTHTHIYTGVEDRGRRDAERDFLENPLERWVRGFGWLM